MKTKRKLKKPRLGNWVVDISAVSIVADGQEEVEQEPGISHDMQSLAKHWCHLLLGTFHLSLAQSALE